MYSGFLYSTDKSGCLGNLFTTMLAISITELGIKILHAYRYKYQLYRVSIYRGSSIKHVSIQLRVSSPCIHD